MTTPTNADGLPPARDPVALRHCWRTERAVRVGFLVDGEEYFGAVRAALRQAQRTIFILGWDIDSRMRLVPDGAGDGLPDGLGAFLDALCRRERRLRVYVLSWDFAMLYLMEREWMPIYKLDGRTHRRLSFRLDAHHPTAASHHQKVVVVDDAVAFVSGFDLTRSRWDTSEHRPNDPRRRDTIGIPYGPFHDVGAVVDGDCARALGELARERWRRATGRPPRRARPPSPGHDPWPAGVAPALTDVEVGIARTEPAFAGRPAVDEVRRVHLAAIAAAKRHVFAENQYFTSVTIRDAMLARLADDDAPEFAIVSPAQQSGWLEVSTMGVLRARVHRSLRQRDPAGRYRLYCPSLPSVDGCLNVHSKVMTVDDDLMTIGSANLSDRSMRLDTECNLVIEANGRPPVREAIAGLRARLLGEHLGVAPAEVAKTLARTGSLHAAIEALHRDGARTLAPLEPALDPDLDAIVPDHSVLDPEQPIDPDELVADLVPHEEARVSVKARIAALVAIVVVLAGVALAWRYTPLREWVNLDALVALGERIEGYPFAPLAVLAAYVGGGLVMVPLTLLIAVTAIVFGPVTGAVYAYAGALASSAVGYLVGRMLGRDAVRRLAGPRVNALSQRLGRRGLLAMALVRLVPIAPFTVINVVAGASHIGWRDFLLGSMIGFAPGILTATLFVDRAIAAARHPGPATFALLAAIAAAALGLTWWMKRRLARAPAPLSRAAHVG